jgi:hypothetical protein
MFARSSLKTPFSAMMAYSGAHLQKTFHKMFFKYESCTGWLAITEK